MTLPSLVVEVDFANAPSSATRTWTDISAYPRAFSSSRGRQTELDQIKAGTASLTLDNSDARFNPSNTSGPYYGFLKPMRPLRVRTVWVPSGTGNLLTENQASLETDTTGWTAGSGTAMARSTAQFLVGAASLSVERSGTVGTASASAAGAPAAPGQTMTAVASLRAGGLSLSGRVSIVWKDSGGSTLSTTVGGSVTATSSGWVQATASAVAPAASATADVLVEFLSAGVGSTCYIDAIQIIAGSSTTWALPTAPAPTFAYPVYSGFVTSWPQQYPGSTDSIVTVQCVDAFRVLANRRLQTSYSAEATGTRIANVLTSADWPTGATHRDLDAGASNVQAETLDESALFHLLITAESDGGLFFVDAAGRAAFVDRTALIGQTLDTDLTWTDDGTGFRYQDIELRPADDSTLWNAVSVTANALTTQTSTDSTSITNHFRRDLTIDTALTSTNDMLARAEYAVARYKDPATRVHRIVLNGMGDTSSWSSIFDREIGDLVRIIRTPPGGGDAIEQDSVIEGIDFAVTPGRFDVSWNTSPADGQQNYFLLDDAVNGLLDANLLGY